MKRRRSLFSPAVGSKSRTSKYPIDDYRNYDVVVEPFAHAGPIAIERLLNFGKPTGARYAIVSDADKSIYAIWKAWLDPDIRKECESVISDYKPKLVFSGTKEEMKVSSAFETYLELKDKFNDADNASYGEMAAYSLLIRKLVFGGVIRCNRQGKLNVTLSWDKVNQFQRWRHEWHELDPLCSVMLLKDQKDCMSALENSSFRNPLVLIDPPYWLPYEPGSKRRGTGSMTPAYISHNPWDDDTFSMAVNSCDRALAVKNAGRVVHTNYWSRPMQKAMQMLAHKYNVPLYTTQIGVLVGMNHARTNTTNRIETAWEFGGRRMFWPKGYKPVEQLDFLAA